MKRDTALIIGNGPSVDKMDPTILDRVYSYGANQIYMKFPAWGRKTDAIAITDPTRLREIGTDLVDYQGKLFVGNSHYVSPKMAQTKSILGRDFIPLQQLTRKELRFRKALTSLRLKRYWKQYVLNTEEMSFNFDKGFRFGGSVVITMIQMAAAEGFRKILLTGVDASFKPQSEYFGGLQKQVLIPSRDMPYNIRMTLEPAFVLLQIYFEDMGIELIDCTPGGALRFIPKGRLEDF